MLSDCHLRVLAAAVLNQEQQPMQVAVLCDWFVPHLQYHSCSWFLNAASRYSLQAYRRRVQAVAGEKHQDPENDKNAVCI